MEKMLVTQGLNELKVLDARIEREIYNAKFIDAAKTSEKNVSAGKSKEDFRAEAISSYDSINALIDRREKIKSAIVESNAITTIEICGDTYSVAKVIDMKSSIKYKQELLRQMKTLLTSATSLMNRCNATMEQQITNLITTAFGKDSKTSIKEDDYNSIAKPYREANEYSLVDPIKIEDKIKNLEIYIEEFLSTVDAKLQVSNCITYIEF